MTPLEKFRQQVAIAKASAAGDLKSYVVQTADEAQALLDEIDRVWSIKPIRQEPMVKAVAKGTLGDGL